MLMLKNKKGISPIIATVLLIAFSVALGAIVMNWQPGIECESVIKLEASEINLIEQICYNINDKQIEATLENLGEKQIEGVKVSVFGANNVFNLNATEIIPPGEAKKILATYDRGLYGTIEKVKFIPLLKPREDEEPFLCVGAALVKNSVREC